MIIAYFCICCVAKDLVMGMHDIEGNWKHPGGKLRELGPEALSEAELLAIIIGTGIKGKSAEQIAEELIQRFGSLMGIAGQPVNKLLKIKGLSDVKIIRIAATFEIARRIVKELRDRGQQT